MRNKYRSAIYVFSDADVSQLLILVKNLQYDFDKKIITQVLPFGAFKSSDSQFHDYYNTNPERPFCRTHIAPKLQLVKTKFSKEYSESTKISSKKE